MIINFNDYFISRINYMISEIENSIAGSRYWVDSDKPCRTYDYVTTRSTFPDYCKFFFYKKPKNWHLLTILEQENEYHFAGNKKELLHILNKSKTNKKLTVRQQLMIEIISCNLTIHEEDW